MGGKSLTMHSASCRVWMNTFTSSVFYRLVSGLYAGWKRRSALLAKERLFFFLKDFSLGFVTIIGSSARTIRAKRKRKYQRRRDGLGSFYEEEKNGWFLRSFAFSTLTNLCSKICLFYFSGRNRRSHRGEKKGVDRHLIKHRRNYS